MQAGFVSRPSLEEIFYNVWNSGKMYERERHGLLSILLGDTTREEQAIVNRLLHAIRRGWIQMVCEEV